MTGRLQRTKIAVGGLPVAARSAAGRGGFLEEV